MSKLLTPEEVAADLHDGISPHTIRRLVRTKQIACTRGAHRKVYFTEAQRDAILAYLADDPATEPTGPGTFKPTARSAAHRRSAK